MKKVLRLVLMISIISLILSISACSNSYNDMIDGFNKKYFKKGYLPPEPYTTSSKDFKEGEMLDEIISMKDDSLTILTAPDGGEESTYEWKALVPKNYFLFLLILICDYILELFHNFQNFLYLILKNYQFSIQIKKTNLL